MHGVDRLCSVEASYCRCDPFSAVTQNVMHNVLTLYPPAAKHCKKTAIMILAAVPNGDRNVLGNTQVKNHRCLGPPCCSNMDDIVGKITAPKVNPVSPQLPLKACAGKSAPSIPWTQWPFRLYMSLAEDWGLCSPNANCIICPAAPIFRYQ